MFGALEFSDKMASYGIQPIIGCELAVDFGDQDPNARNALHAAPARIVLLAARERGYRSLMRLNSRAFLETPTHQSPHIKFEWLEGDTEDVIALTGGPDGPISLALAADHAALAATRLRPAGRPVRRPPLCRIATPRRREGASRRDRADQQYGGLLCPVLRSFVC